jgi:hypothetical protein
MSQSYDDPRCPKCSGEMHEGFIADYTEGAVLQEEWVQGPPEPSLWYGTKVRNKERLHVVTFRCATCGYLESYAWERAG